MSKTTKIVVLGDVHLPLHSGAAVTLAMKVCARVQPDIIVQIGDLMDVVGLSTHEKQSKWHGLTLAEEVRYGKAFIRSCRRRGGRFVLTSGNHDARVERFLGRVPELASTHPSVEDLLELEASEFRPYREPYRVGKMLFVHDLGPAGTQALRQTLEAAGANICFGHTHQLGALYDGNLAGDRHVALNVGWLGNPDHATYAPPRARARWQHGVGYVEVYGDGTCLALPIPFVAGTANLPGVGKVSL